MYGVMWNFSLDCDREMECDPNWHDTPEGKAAMYWIREENKRLSLILDRQKGDDGRLHTDKPGAGA